MSTIISRFLNRYKRYSVSILDSEWKPMYPTIRVKFVPRKDEIIFISDKYYRVIGIVHNIINKQGIFLIIEELEQNNN